MHAVPASRQAVGKCPLTFQVWGGRLSAAALIRPLLLHLNAVAAVFPCLCLHRDGGQQARRGLAAGLQEQVGKGGGDGEWMVGMAGGGTGLLRSALCREEGRHAGALAMPT
jgi:hypothetical protein